MEPSSSRPTTGLSRLDTTAIRRVQLVASPGVVHVVVCLPPSFLTGRRTTRVWVAAMRFTRRGMPSFTLTATAFREEQFT